MWNNAGRLYVPLCDPLHIGSGWTRSTEETASKKSFQGRVCLSCPSVLRQNKSNCFN